METIVRRKRWVKIGFVKKVTGWNKYEMQRARQQKLIEWERCPDGDPTVAIEWHEQLDPVGAKALKPGFIQAIGEAIEKHDE